MSTITEHYSDEAIPFLPGHAKHAARENANQAFCEIDELCQRWKDRISVENLALAKRYVEAEMEFGLVLEAGESSAPIGNQFVAIFKRELAIDSGTTYPNGRGQMISAGIDCIVPDSEIPMGCGNRNQQNVFVGYVNSVQTTDGVIPSRIRLETADEFYRSCARAIKSFDGARSKMGLAPTYWERSAVVGRPAVFADQDVCEKIEGGSKIVDAIANDGAPVDGNSLAFAKAVNFVTGLRVYIHNDGVRLSALKSLDGRIKVRKMLFGPVNLYPHAT
jgi:hypothetical protein